MWISDICGFVEIIAHDENNEEGKDRTDSNTNEFGRTNGTICGPASATLSLPGCRHAILIVKDSSTYFYLSES